jgi:hypothetical protein
MELYEITGATDCSTAAEVDRLACQLRIYPPRYLVSPKTIQVLRESVVHEANQQTANGRGVPEAKGTIRLTRIARAPMEAGGVRGEC